MSATVTYKGATLTTATNQTRTLDTAGTYLEDDITITDVTTIPTGTKNISITANGTTTEDVTSYASASITANVPNSYTASDEGKVVSNGSLVSQSSATYTENDTYDTTLVDEVTVNVSGGASVTAQDIYDGTFPSGDVVINNVSITGISLYGNTVMTSFTSSSITQFKASSAFYGCTALKTVNLTGTITQSQANMWQGCTNLESIEMPNYSTSIGQFAIGNNPKLTFADIGKCTQIIANAFNGCTILDKIVIRRTSVCSLQNVSAFTGTPFASGGTGGTIYVPSALISSYQSATNWSTLHGYGTVTWAALEGSDYE